MGVSEIGGCTGRSASEGAGELSRLLGLGLGAPESKHRRRELLEVN